MEIIGVVHERPYHKDLIRYLRKNHNPKSIWLEIDLGSQGVEYFSDIELEFQDEAVIYRGDVDKDVANPVGSFLYSKYEDASCNLLARVYYAAYRMSHPFCALNPYHIYKREKGMIRSVRETNPDIVVSGLMHAHTLKEEFPESTFTQFMVHSPLHYLLHSFEKLPAIILGSKPDRIVWVKHEENN